MRLNGWEFKALIAGVCLGLIGCTSGNPASKTVVNNVPQAQPQADRHVQDVAPLNINPTDVNGMLAQLPPRISADQAGKLLVHLDGSQIATDKTYSVQARGGNGGHGVSGMRGGDRDRSFSDRDRDRDFGNRFRGNRFNSFGLGSFFGLYGAYGLYGGLPYLGYPYSSYAYYPYGSYYYPYYLSAGNYYPYSYGGITPFMYYNRTSSLYNPYYWQNTAMAGQQQPTASGTAPMGTQSTNNMGQTMPMGFGGY